MSGLFEAHSPTRSHNNSPTIVMVESASETDKSFRAVELGSGRCDVSVSVEAPINFEKPMKSVLLSNFFQYRVI